MTVVDASVLVDGLVVVGPAGDAARAVLRDRQVLHVPSIFTAEVTSALRALCARQALDVTRARAALAQLKTLRTVLYPFEPFVDRVWELRESVTVYDGWYVALAEFLECELVTADRRLTRAGGVRCPVLDVATFVPAPRTNPDP
ncbi:MAG: type II toxin-antitoxin system VapC family toxin [Pseudonocardia sp.]